MTRRGGYGRRRALLCAAVLALTCRGDRTGTGGSDGGRAALPAPSGTLAVYFLDVDQGDSTVITTPAGKTILIDGAAAAPATRERTRAEP